MVRGGGGVYIQQMGHCGDAKNSPFGTHRRNQEPKGFGYYNCILFTSFKKSDVLLKPIFLVIKAPSEV
jgi:hypothetical protein